MNGPAADNSGFNHLVEAATALTQLVNTVPASKEESEKPSNNKPHAISDDEERPKVATPEHAEKAAVREQPSPIKNVMTNKPAIEGSKEIFPQRLMHILSQKSISDIITWLPHGQSFVIIRPTILAEKILPVYFPESCGSSSHKKTPKALNGSTCKYPSFTRKLNRWGFRQVCRGADAGAFHHKLFQRDKPELCLQMVCQRSRRRKVEKKADLKAPSAETNPVNAHSFAPYSALMEGTILADNRKRKASETTFANESLVTDSDSVASSTSNNGDSKTLPMKKRLLSDNSDVATTDQGPASKLRMTTPPPVPVSLSSQSTSSSALSSKSNSPHHDKTNDVPLKAVESIQNQQPTLPVFPQQGGTYLDARALLEHNITMNNISSLNAAMAMVQAQAQASVQQQQQQQQQPNLQNQALQNMSNLLNCANLTALAQQQQQIPTATTISPPAPASVSQPTTTTQVVHSTLPDLKIPTNSTQQQNNTTNQVTPIVMGVVGNNGTAAITPQTSTAPTTEAERRAMNAKSMLYSAFLNALG